MVGRYLKRCSNYEANCSMKIEFFSEFLTHFSNFFAFHRLQLLTVCSLFRQEKAEKEAKEVNSEPERVAKKPHKADQPKLVFK